MSNEIAPRDGHSIKGDDDRLIAASIGAVLTALACSAGIRLVRVGLDAGVIQSLGLVGLVGQEFEIHCGHGQFLLCFR